MVKVNIASLTPDHIWLPVNIQAPCTVSPPQLHVHRCLGYRYKIVHVLCLSRWDLQ